MPQPQTIGAQPSIFTIASRPRATDEHLDSLLTAQILVAWAGESGRLGWWRTKLVSRYGGLDFFAALTPGSAVWAALQAVREAARRHDAERRGQAGEPDAKLTLYHLGFDLDEQADERLRHHKRSGAAPTVALPRIAEFIRLPTGDGDDDEPGFEPQRFEQFLRDDKVKYTVEAGRRRLVGAAPEDLQELVRRLLAALVPLRPNSGTGGESHHPYPLPYYSRKKS